MMIIIPFLASTHTHSYHGGKYGSRTIIIHTAHIIFLRNRNNTTCAQSFAFSLFLPCTWSTPDFRFHTYANIVHAGRGCHLPDITITHNMEMTLVIQWWLRTHHLHIERRAYKWVRTHRTPFICVCPIKCISVVVTPNPEQY